MSRKFSSLLTKSPSLTSSTKPITTLFNTSQEIVLNDKQSKIQRWIFGMIVGSAPFLVILFCWMFVSLCINNFVRLYQYKKNQYRRDLRINDIETIPSKIDV